MVSKRPRAQTIKGSDHTKPGEQVVLGLTERAVAGMTPGRKSAVKRKQDGNEDALAYVPINHQTDLFLVADSHFGAMPANLAVTSFESCFRDLSGSNPRRLFFSHLILDTAIREAKQATSLGPASATTLVSVTLKGDTAAYCSTGDSILYLLRGNHMEEVYERHQSLFLGDGQKPIDRFVRHLEKLGAIDDMTSREQVHDTLFQLSKIFKQVHHRRVDPPSVVKILDDLSRKLGIPFPIEADEISEPHFFLNTEMAARLPVWGSFNVREGDVLLLASDGLDKDVSDCPTEEVQAILDVPETPLEEIAENLLIRCSGKYGGGDNLSFILVRL